VLQDIDTPAAPAAPAAVMGVKSLSTTASLLLPICMLEYLLYCYANHLSSSTPPPRRPSLRDRQVRREARKVLLIRDILPILHKRYSHPQSDLCLYPISDDSCAQSPNTTHPCRREHSHLLRFGRPSCHVLIRHGLHLQLLGLAVSHAIGSSSYHTLTFGTATCKLTVSTLSLAVNRARI
jgi:hypothetical protein